MSETILKCGHRVAVERIANISGGAYVRYTCIKGCDTEWVYIGAMPDAASIDMEVE